MFNYHRELRQIRSSMTDREIDRDEDSLTEKVDVLRKSTLPNELAYIVDCRKAEIQTISTARTVLLNSPIRAVEEIYEHAHPGFFPSIVKYSKNLVKHIMPSTTRDHDDLLLTNIYKTANNQVYYKRTGVLMFDQKGTPTYTFGILSDITGFGLKPFRMQYHFYGTDSEAFYLQMNGLMAFKSVLGKQEIRILELVKEGLQSQEIGNRLFISKHTVDTHRRNIMRKLEAANSIEAITKAQQFGII
mgnify:FL=1